MAVRWAVANGNWNAGATWNGGVVPVDGDEIYLNGYTINSNVNFNLRNSEIRNDANSEYNIVAGGTLNANHRQGCIFFAKKFVVGTSNFFYQVYSGGVFNGDVELRGGTFCFKAGSDRGFSWSLNGNVHRVNGTNGTLFNDGSHNSPSITIVGNITDDGSGGTITRSGTVNLTVNGNVQWNGSLGGTTTRIIGNYTVYGVNVSTTTLQVSGNMRITRGRVLCTTCNFGGTEILYSDTDNNTGLLAQTINFINDNANTFVWKDISETRLNPFIILTNADMENTDQYPPEDEVKEGTEYAWGEKVGTYQQPPESVVLSGYEYDTITAEENDIATYNAVRYIYADYGILHWFELKTTTTDIVTDPTLQSISIDGETVVADTDYVVAYNDVCYQWSGSAWGSITTKNIGTVKTDIVTNQTETTLAVKKGTLETSNISQQLISRLENCATVETVQQLLVAHLDN